LRFRFFPSAFAGCAVPSASGQLADHPAAAFYATSGTHAIGCCALAVFRASRLHGLFLLGDAAHAGHSWPVFSAHVPGPRWGSYRSLAGRISPGDAHGIFSCPLQLCSGSRVRLSFDASPPPAVSPAPRREFHRRGVRRFRRAVGFWAAAPGVWPREPAVPCHLPAPPWLLCTGPIKHISHCCFGLHILSQVFVAGRQVSTSGAFPPMGLCAIALVFLQETSKRCARPSAYRAAGG